MKLNPTIGNLLYELFGPNGSDAFVHRNQKLRFRGFQELERHGLVELVGKDPKSMPGLFSVTRVAFKNL